MFSGLKDRQAEARPVRCLVVMCLGLLDFPPVVKDGPGFVEGATFHSGHGLRPRISHLRPFPEI